MIQNKIMKIQKNSKNKHYIKKIAYFLLKNNNSVFHRFYDSFCLLFMLRIIS